MKRKITGGRMHPDTLAIVAGAMAVLMVGCDPAEVLGLDPELTLRPEGAWDEDVLAGVVDACAAWGDHMGPRACRIDPNGSIALVRTERNGVYWSRSAMRLDLGVTHTREQAVWATTHAVAIMGGFVEKDSACGATSARAANDACWGNITPLDVARCEEAGWCR